MQSFDTDEIVSKAAGNLPRTIVIGRFADFPVGSRKTVELPDEHQIALYNIDGEIYAIENSCPPKGAQLSEGILCDRVIECDWHGWQFDLRNGECLSVREKVEMYEVVIEDGLIRVVNLEVQLDAEPGAVATGCQHSMLKAARTPLVHC